MIYYLKKIFDLLITVFLVTLITFLTFNILPGNPAEIILGPDADEVQIEMLEKELNLDKPLYTRYFSWIKNALHGDLGKSYRFNTSVNRIINEAAKVTLSLSIFAIILTILTGIPLGIILARFNRNPFIKAIESISMIFFSTPAFCTALLLILIFTVKFNLFPSMGYTPFTQNPGQFIKTLFLPALSIALGSGAILSRYLKTDFADQMSKDYVKTAESKGLSPFSVAVNHILRNSLISVVTTLGLLITDILGGSIIIENIFSIPGIGKLIASSVSTRDFPLISGLVLYLALITVLCNFVIDILYGIIDPRIRTSYKSNFFLKRIFLGRSK